MVSLHNYGFFNHTNYWNCTPNGKRLGPQTTRRDLGPWSIHSLTHRIHVCYIYSNIYHQYTPVMLAYIPAPWIRHGSYNWSKSKVKMNPTLQVHQKRLHQRGILVSSGVKKHPTKLVSGGNSSTHIYATCLQMVLGMLDISWYWLSITEYMFLDSWMMDGQQK